MSEFNQLLSLVLLGLLMSFLTMVFSWNAAYLMRRVLTLLDIGSFFSE